MYLRRFLKALEVDHDPGLTDRQLFLSVSLEVFIYCNISHTPTSVESRSCPRSRITKDLESMELCGIVCSNLNAPISDCV